MYARIAPLSQRKGFPKPTSKTRELFPLRFERILSRVRYVVFIELVDGLISKTFDSPLGVIKFSVSLYFGSQIRYRASSGPWS